MYGYNGTKKLRPLKEAGKHHDRETETIVDNNKSISHVIYS